MFVLALDSYSLGDPLFLTGLARDLQARHAAGGSGFLIVHGTGEAGERALEALGAEPERADGALVIETPEAAAAVERAARELNRSIVHELSEVGVHALRVTGLDRGLIRPDGTLGKTAWLAQAAGARTVPVIVGWGPGKGGSGAETVPARLSAQLSSALGGLPIVALGTPEADSAQVPLATAREWVHDPEALGHMASGGGEVRVVRRSALRRPGIPAGPIVIVDDR